MVKISLSVLNLEKSGRSAPSIYTDALALHSLLYHSQICICFRQKSWGDEDKVSGKITSSTKSMCSSVAKLTQWADRVITEGRVDPSEDYVNQVIEPVRFAVNSLASNLLAISIVPKSTSFHNSLPDLGKLFNSL